MVVLICVSLGFPCGSAVKNPPAMQEMQDKQFRSLSSGRYSGGGNGNTFQYSNVRNPMEREPGSWGLKELDAAEGLKKDTKIQRIKEIITEGSSDSTPFAFSTTF